MSLDTDIYYGLESYRLIKFIAIGTSFSDKNIIRNPHQLSRSWLHWAVGLSAVRVLAGWLLAGDNSEFLIEMNDDKVY